MGLADHANGAIERARSLDPDAILVAAALVQNSDVMARLNAEKDLARVPRFVLVSDDTEQGAFSGFEQLSYSDPGAIAKKLFALVRQTTSVVPASEDFRGDLKQVSMADLLQLLAMNARTGTLSINTMHGAGEVRLVGGEVVDAVFRRMEGEKALYRLFAENEGSFAFATSTASPHRRIQVPTHALLMEGMRASRRGAPGHAADRRRHGRASGAEPAAAGRGRDPGPRRRHADEPPHPGRTARRPTVLGSRHSGRPARTSGRRYGAQGASGSDSGRTRCSASASQC